VPLIAVALALLGGRRGAGWQTITPSRAPVLTIMLVVAARLAYGFWRSGHAWPASAGDRPWLVASAAAGSRAAGARVLGDYLVEWANVWRRIGRHRRTAV